MRFDRILVTTCLIFVAGCNLLPLSDAPDLGAARDLGRAADLATADDLASRAAPVDLGRPIVGKRVFVTSATFGPFLGGLAGGDQKCNTVAQAMNVEGTWVAWLSDSTHDAIDRIPGNGPWVLVDGTVLFNNRAGLTLTPLAPIDRDEVGRVNHVAVWTGTFVGGGGAPGYACQDWTPGNGVDVGSQVVIGGSGLKDSRWTEASTDAGCFGRAALYCFER